MFLANNIWIVQVDTYRRLPKYDIDFLMQR